MNLNTASGPFKIAVQTLDLQLKRLSDLFLIIANGCLALMLVGTAATIILRLFDISFYWIWPWTMQFFVWMSFVGFYVVYRKGKDISVDFLVLKLGANAMRITQIGVPLLIIILMIIMLAQMPTILSSQVGVIDGVVTPWGELERYTLSIPLGISCFLILINSTVTILKIFVDIDDEVHSTSEG
jgi:TRAP-type C4-dicarboxylate transport system permease small subunit